jgi:hypothetical protein
MMEKTSMGQPGCQSSRKTLRLIPGSVWSMLMVLLTMAGCTDTTAGVACIIHEDCGSGICRNGICGNNDHPDGGDSDTGSVSPLPYMNAVELLFVVDNSNSMEQEQELLATSMYAMINSLLAGVNHADIDLRLGVVTSDMGVSYEGGMLAGEESWFFDSTCSDHGDNGGLIGEYSMGVEGAGALTIAVSDEVIKCNGNTEPMGCPADWTCVHRDMMGNGVCAPINDYTKVNCPPVSEYLGDGGYLTPRNWISGDIRFAEFIAAGACLTQRGTGGCNFEQPLAAVSAAVSGSQGQAFLRANAMTVVVMITDEEDCSVANPDWYHVDELGTIDINLACGRHPGMMRDVKQLQEDIIEAKSAISGADASGTMMFAAITGVPVGSMCEGRGDRIDNCLSVRPNVNGNGTMGSPDTVERLVGNGGSRQIYFEYACRRYAEGESEEAGDIPITAAYPAPRIVQMAQEFGTLGFVYSICREDWTTIMSQIGATIAQRLDVSAGN